MEYYYKVVPELYRVGEVIDTNQCVNSNRVLRNEELKLFFEKTYNLSIRYNLPIITILTSKYLTPKLILKSFNNLFAYINEIRQLNKERERSHFQLFLDRYYFIDYILEKSRIDLQKDKNVVLPSRFKSCFFFGTEAESRIYKENFNLPQLQIIKVQFINKTILRKYDNNLISDFHCFSTASEYESQSKLFLKGHISDNSLIEFVFQGKFKVISII
jgi:hypothetical protein